MSTRASYRATLFTLIVAALLTLSLVAVWSSPASSDPAASAPDAPEQIIVIPVLPTATRTPTPVNFGNFVWDDLDQDGRQDAGEPGLAGITVQLWNSAKTDLIDQSSTNGSGNYTVQSPGPGNYRIRVVLPSILDQFSPKDNAAAGDTADSDINPTGSSIGFTDIIAVASNVISISNLDAGIILFRTPTPTRTPTPVNFGNFVWDDLDQDGRQDAGEPGLAGITVQLWNSSKSSLIDQDVTNGSGIYSLQSPGPGSYRVRVVLPNILDQFSPKDQAGGDDTDDSDINPSGGDIGFTDIINVASNVISISNIDAGLIKFRTATPTRTPTPINIGNFVWDDLDQDGRQDAGEPGLAGVTVQLWNSTKTSMLSQTSTNGNGNYTLVAPLPGSYRVRVVLPNILDQLSPKDSASATDTTDSDFNPSGTNIGFTDIISIASNVISISSIDAGIIKFRTATPTRTPTPINIGNFVWNDLNSDGDQDAGEPGLVGITVQLWNSAKSVQLDSDVTDLNGNYSVVAPVPGTYFIRVIAPVGALFSPKDQAGGDDTEDSDFNSTGFTDAIAIASNVISISNIDAGLRSVPATPSVTPSSTTTPTPSTTPSPTATLTATPTETLTPSLTPTATNTQDPLMTWTPTSTPSITPTLTPSITLTPSATLDPSITPSATPNPVITDTPEPSATPTQTDTPDPAFSPTPTPTETLEPTDDGVVFVQDTPTPTSEPYFPTPPAAPMLGSSTDGPIRGSFQPGFDLYARPLVINGEFIIYYGMALTDPASIGIAGLEQLGVLTAVDLFSPSGRTYFEGGFVVCLEGTGTLIWLDASNAPRHPEIIGSYTVPEWPGFTCATLFTPGSLVLIERNPMQMGQKRR